MLRTKLFKHCEATVSLKKHFRLTHFIVLVQFNSTLPQITVRASYHTGTSKLPAAAVFITEDRFFVLCWRENSDNTQGMGKTQRDDESKMG